MENASSCHLLTHSFTGLPGDSTFQDQYLLRRVHGAFVIAFKRETNFLCHNRHSRIMRSKSSFAFYQCEMLRGDDRRVLVSGGRYAGLSHLSSSGLTLSERRFLLHFCSRAALQGKSSGLRFFLPTLLLTLPCPLIIRCAVLFAYFAATEIRI